MTTILVTGGAGFIGSNFVRMLSDYKIVVVDKLTYAGNRKNLEGLDVTFIRGDITSEYEVGWIFSQHEPEYVVNLAAETHVDRSIAAPQPFVDTNVFGTFRLLEAARKMRKYPRFLQVSTDEVYGSIAPDENTHVVTYNPSSPYAATKAAGDLLCLAYYKTYGLPAMITNGSNTYGPRQYPEKLIPLVIKNALAGEQIPIYGDGKNVRDWLYVEDHCNALLRVLLNGTPGERYNVGGGCERTNVEVVDAICEVLRERTGKDYRALKTFVADRLGHDRRYAVDSTKIRSELGWTPVWDFKTGLENTINWYLK